MECVHTSKVRIMTNIIIGIIVLLLSTNFIMDTNKPCPVKWYSDLRNHQERMDKCKFRSRNRFVGWELKE